jgi:hypothetical protein
MKPIGSPINTVIGRLWSRCADSQDGLVLGSLLKEGAELFGKNTIWQIEQCPLTEEIKLVKVGKAALVREDNVNIDSEDAIPGDQSIGLEYQNLKSILGAEIFLSKAEWARQTLDRIERHKHENDISPEYMRKLGEKAVKILTQELKRK